MKKTIWIPAVIGIVSSVLILSAAEANFFIPLGKDVSMGIGELFTTLSAALGGPIASIVTIFLVYSVHSVLHPEYFPNMTTIYIVIADAITHLCAMLVVVICYYKFLYPRARKTGFFLAGWFLTIGVYYYLALLPLTVVLQNLANPEFGPTYSSLASGFFPEFLGTAILTTLIWLAMPVHYRYPLWIKPTQTPDRSGDIHDE